MPTKNKKTKKNKSTKDIILVIVESPAKAKTINKYLGNQYKVLSSMGHVIDLPKSRLGVDVENNFTPEYITIRGKGKILNELKKNAAKSSLILLASDNDREGEAIAFHIENALSSKYPDKPIKRITFNEITKTAILEALNHQRELDINKINAQKTRRILDRLVGYNISPILWAKVKNGLSAGRVQSVSLKIICEREEEIDAFIPKEYWSLEAIFTKSKKDFTAELFKLNGKKPNLESKKDIDALLKQLQKGDFIVSSIKETFKSVKPLAPLITSKLQQTAANRFGFTSRKTMSIAQQLYEGIDLGKETVGLITYMRTDSTRISDQAINEVRDFIGQNYEKNLPEKPRIYSKSKDSQDAHEAIRPTSVFRTPSQIKQYLTKDQFKIYSIIWERFVSSQMINAEHKTQTIQIQNDPALFKISKSSIVNEGFNAVLNLLKSKETGKRKALPKLQEGDKVELKEFLPQQHFTQPPPRFTDATIIKFLEEKGIGRPSTYAPIISTLISRYYITRKSRQLVPTILGKLVNKIITESFPDIVDTNFTANMEDNLDKIANGEIDNIKLLSDFYTPFKKKVDLASETLEDHKRMFDEETDEVCEKCGRPMIKKLGRYGFFLACTGFPECMNAKAIPLADCPIDGCNGKIVAKRNKKRGREFYGCTNYPDCEFVTWNKPTEFKCPKCGKFLVEKSDKIHGTYKACVDEKNCGYKQLEEHSNN